MGHKNEKYVDFLNNIRIIQIELKGLKIERDKLLEKYDEKWEIVKKYGKDLSIEIRGISKNIGTINHRINCLITSLLSYRGHEEVMELAIDYLDSEIDRLSGIYEHRVEIKSMVKNGMSYYIYSDGRTTNDPNSDNDYITKKKEQVEKMKEKKAKILECMQYGNDDYNIDDSYDEEYMPDMMEI